MFRMRTDRGIEMNEYESQYLLPFAPLEQSLRLFEKKELALCTEGRWHLTGKGFLLSNQIITTLLVDQDDSTPLTKKR